MELYLLRHAIAEKRQSRQPRRDRDRPLTDDGIRKMRRIARGLRILDVGADLILSSSLRRARQTAEIVAAELGSAVPELTPFLDPGADGERLCVFLARRAQEAEKIILVGHEPALSGLASMLLSGDQRMRIVMKKGGICKLCIDRLRWGRCATLVWLLSPRVVEGLK